MSQRRPLPALLIIHDDAMAPVGERVAALRTEALRTLPQVSADNLDFDPEHLASVGADEILMVIHVVGPIEDRSNRPSDDDAQLAVDTVLDCMAQANHILRRDYANLKPQHWIIQAVGDAVDQSEQFLIDTYTHPQSQIGGVLVVSSATHASVNHNWDAQLCFAADAAVLLAASQLRGELEGSGTAWAVASTSVTYNAQRHERLAALQQLAPLVKAQLLSPPNDESGRDAAARWLEEQPLDDTNEIEALLGAGSGGSVRRLVQMDTLTFDTARPEEWVEQVSAAADQRRHIGLPEARIALERNVDRRLSALRSSLFAETLQELDDSGNLAQTADFVDALAVKLESAIKSLAALKPAAHGLEDKRHVLLDRISTLPYRAATASRVSGLMMGEYLLLNLVAPALGPVVAGVTIPLRFLLPGGLAIAGSLWQKSKELTVVRLRNSLVEAHAKSLDDELKAIAEQHRLDLLQKLHQWIDGSDEHCLRGWLALLEAEHKGLFEINPATARPTGFVTSEFAVELPVSNETGADDVALLFGPNELAQPLTAFLRESCDGNDLSAIPQLELTDFWTSLVTRPSASLDAPATLLDRLKQSSQHLTVVAEQTSIDVTPKAASYNAATQPGEVRRYLAVPCSPDHPQVQAIINAPISAPTHVPLAQLDATIAIDSPDFVALLHLVRIHTYSTDPVIGSGS